MAKTKTYAVTVTWTKQHTVYVEARRPNGAVEKVLGSDSAWAHATRYDEDAPMFRPFDAKVVDVREVGT